MKLNSLYDIKEALWDNYPCYILYNQYKKNFYIDTIQFHDARVNQYPWIILSQFSDDPLYTELSYQDYCLAFDQIQQSLIQYLQDSVINLSKATYKEGINE